MAEIEGAREPTNAAGTKRRRLVYVCVSLANGDVDRCNQLAGAGWDVLAIQWQSSTAEYIWDEAEGRRFDYLTVAASGSGGIISAPRNTMKLMGLVISARPYIAITYSYHRFSFFLSNVALSLIGVRHRYSLHDSKMDDYQRYFYKDFLKILLTSVYTGFLAASSRSVYYLRYLGLRNISTYYCASDLTKFRVAAAQVSDEYRFNDGGFICIARFVEKKNHLRLLSAYEAYLRQSNREKPRKLILCGYGPLEEAIRAAISRSALLSQNVELVSATSRNEVAALVAKSFCSLLASYHEEFGISIVKSLAGGCPVIASSICGAADLVEDFQNGFTLDPCNSEGWARCMMLLEKDQASWSEFSANAIASAQIGDATSFPGVIDTLISWPGKSHPDRVAPLS